MTEIKSKAQTTVTKPTKLNDFVKLFSQYKETIAQIMPSKAIEVERVILIASKVFAESEYLQKCEPASMVGAVIQAAVHGMNPDPSAGLVYFVPYGNKVKLMLGYKGQELQAYKSGMVESISTHCIYEGDKVVWNFATMEKVQQHEPGPNWGVDDSKITWVYSKFWIRGGGVVCQPINRAMVEKRRAASSNTSNDPKKNPWIANYRQMAEKCAIKETADHAPKHDDWRDVDGSVSELNAFRRDGSGRSDFDTPTWGDEPTNTEGSAEVLPNETDAEKTERENREAFERNAAKEGTLFNGEGAK